VHRVTAAQLEAERGEHAALLAEARKEAAAAAKESELTLQSLRLQAEAAVRSGARGAGAWAIGGRCTALTRSRLAQERRREKDAARIEKLLADQQQWSYLQRKAAVEEAAAASGYIRSLEETLYESSQADSESEMAVSVEENDAHADHRISASDRATPQTQPRVVVPAVAESPSAETRAQIDAELLAALRSRRAALPGATNKKARQRLAKKIRAMEQVPTTF
jgi:vacuolar-type H+-ATPase subunit D/Vma8